MPKVDGGAGGKGGFDVGRDEEEGRSVIGEVKLEGTADGGGEFRGGRGGGGVGRIGGGGSRGGAYLAGFCRGEGADC